MKKVLLVIPENSYKSNDFVIAAKKMKLKFTIITDSEQVSTEFSDNIIVTDFTQDINHEILSKLKDITHVLPVDHSSLIYASKLRDSLSSVGNSNSSVVTSMDKYLSRKIFNDVSNIKIKHNYVNSLKDIETFLSIHNVGVLKPTNGTASNKVIKLESNSIQTESIYEIIDECYDNRFIIEEFVDGMEYAFEGMLINSKLHRFTIFDKPLIFAEPYFEESIYIAPSNLSQETISKITLQLENATKKLGLENGPIHAEFKIIDNELFIIEINPRMIGGLCSRCLNFGLFKQSQEELILSSFISSKFKNIELLNKYVGVLMLPVPKTGLFKSINLDEIEAVDNISSVEITVSKDSKLQMPPNGEKYLGFAFSQGENKHDVLSALKQALEVSSPVIHD